MIKRKKPLSRVPKRKPDRSVGKVSGTVRLSGKELTELREQRWNLDKGICRLCGWPTFFEPRFDGDPLAYDLAHIKSRGSGGGDTLENTMTAHHSCHMKLHAKGKR